MLRRPRSSGYSFPLACFDCNEGCNQTSGIAAVRLDTNDQSRNRRNLVHAIRPMLRQRAVLVVRVVFGWRAWPTAIDDVRMRRNRALSRCNHIKSMIPFAPKRSSPSKTLPAVSFTVQVPSANSEARMLLHSPPVRAGLLEASIGPTFPRRDYLWSIVRLWTAARADFTALCDACLPSRVRRREPSGRGQC